MDKAVEILLVEDSDEDAELTIRTLKKQKVSNLIHHVYDGEAALEWLYKPGVRPKPRVILLDLKLPKVTGLEVLRRLKSETSTMAIPVVVLTSSKEDRDLKEAYALGVNSYIVKPVEFDKFVTAVETLGLYWVLLNEPRG
jgi:two-component system response regulator